MKSGELQGSEKVGLLSFAIGYLIFPGLVFATFAGLLFEGIDRKVGAHIQSRIGPPIWQPFIDMIKLFGKEDITPDNSQRVFFNLAPLLSFGAIITVMVMLPFSAAGPIFSAPADLLIVIYLLNIVPFALMLGGASSSTPFGQIGMQRYAVQLLAYELPFIIAAITVAGAANWSLNIAEIVGAQSGSWQNWFIFQTPLAAIAAFLSCPGKLLKVPFDIPEADTEIVMGPLAEYSGPKLAIFHISQDIELLAVAGFIAAIFLGGPQSLIIGGLVIPGFVIFFLKCLAILLLLTFIRTANARLKIRQTLKFYWTFIAGIALINLIWVAI